MGEDVRLFCLPSRGMGGRGQEGRVNIQRDNSRCGGDSRKGWEKKLTSTADEEWFGSGAAAT